MPRLTSILPSDEKGAGEPLLQSDFATGKQQTRNNSSKTAMIIIYLALSLLVGLIFINLEAFTAYNISSEGLEKGAWKTLKEHVSLLDVPAITREEFIERQSILAAALDDAGIDAFIAEPSASSSYYANISASYSLSERPFLIILDKSGKFSYLAPKFELGRIAGLQMVYKNKKVIKWAEEESPYEVLKRETNYKKIMVDEHVRYMIASGLQATGIEVVPTSQAIQSLRTVKTEAEIAILRGINEFTLELVRSLQKNIKIGMSQETIFSVASALFTRAGVGKGYWALVLFGAQAANPHGGSSENTLQNGEFVLIDIGSKLHGYGSDVTRTILPSNSKVSKDLMGIWKTVQAAQSAAIEHMRINETCSDVDAISRKIIADVGYGPFFTHRLGHGLGLEMHEHPYLNGANDEKLKAGEVVTNEPVRPRFTLIMIISNVFREYTLRVNKPKLSAVMLASV
jgi:Xaa-Pro aminopeptidase